MLDLTKFTHLTFDCYGTLIDWETGILDALGSILSRHERAVEPGELLGMYADAEAAEESDPYRPYRSILRGVVDRIATSAGFVPDDVDRDTLVVVSNIDDDIFRETSRVLGDPFNDVITAQQVGSYKPDPANFRFALDRIGEPVDRVLHVAQSLYHDHAPAKRLGFSTVWINRASRRPGVGVAPAVNVVPDLELPDMRSLADRAT